MRNIIIVFLIVILSSTNVWSSVDRIVEDLKLFGVCEDTISDVKLDLFVRDLYDSLLTNESVAPLYKESKLLKKYSFKELPLLKLYTFESFPMHDADEWYFGAIYNTSDSTIYRFGSGYIAFSKVMEIYLPQIFEKDRIEKLIELYLNTLSARNPYYILYDFDQYKRIWSNFIERQPGSSLKEYFIKLSEEDINSIEKYSFFYRIYKFENKNGPYYDANLSTWEKEFGNIEAWNILVSEKIFEVRRKYPEILDKGPNTKLYR